MRKQFLLMLILCLAASVTWAERIDVATARKVAESVATGGGSSLRSSADLSLVYAAAPGQSGTALRSGRVEGSADYFVFNFPGDGGFAIVAGDDRVRPVLGYSHEGSFDPDNLPENLRGMLASYQKQISWMEEHGTESTPEVSAEWTTYINGTSLRSNSVNKVSRLETVEWGQGQPYNLYSPSSLHPSGCVATAMAIVMKYHGSPTEASEANRIPIASSEYGYRTYNWDNMLSSSYLKTEYTESQAQEVARLMRQCGVNTHMRYGLDGSGTTIENAASALIDVFGYTGARIVYTHGRTENEWETIIRNELDSQRPVIYEGQREFGSGHVFVIDGYDPDGMFYINWGWDGMCNGYYPLSLLDPDDDDPENFYETRSMIVNITPNGLASEYTLHLTNSLSGSATVYPTGNYYAMIGAYILNESTKPFNGFICLGKVTGESAYTPISKSQRFTLEGGASYVPYTIVAEGDKLTKGDKVAILYSADISDTPSNWVILNGGEAIKWNITAMNQGDLVEEETGGTNFVIRKGQDDFNNRYLGTNMDNEGLTIYEAANAKMVCLRYKLKDLSWLSDLNISYKSFNSQIGNEENLPYLPLEFDKEGVAWSGTFLAAERSAENYKLNIRSQKEGFLRYTVEVYDESKQTLLGKFDETRLFIKPVKLSVTPIDAGMLERVKFSVNIGSDIDERIKYKKALMYIRLVDENIGTLDGERLEVIRTTSLTSPTHQVQFTSQDYKLEGKTFPSKIGHIGSSVTLTPSSEWDIDFSFLSWGTLQGKLVVELRAQEDAMQGNVSLNTEDILPVANSIVDMTVSNSYMIQMEDLKNLHTDIVDNVFVDCVYVKQGNGYTFKLIEDEGYKLPHEISIEIMPESGTSSSKFTDYTYDSSTGEVVIHSVTGKLLISAEATVNQPDPEPKHFTITQVLTNLTSDKANTVTVLENAKHELTLKAAANYRLPDAIAILNGETPLTTGTDYAYDKASGKVTIHKVTADLTIKASGIDDRHFMVAFDLEGVKADPSSIDQQFLVGEKASFNVKFAAAEGYDYEGTISVKMGDQTLTAGTDYTYDKETGVFALTNGITATLTISAKAVKKQYKITTTYTCLTPMEVPNTVAHGDPMSFKFVPDEGYNLPKEIEVKMAGTVLTAGEGYTYNQADGTVTIAKVTGDVEVTAVAVVKTYAVKQSLTNLTSDFVFGTMVAHGEPLDIQLTAPAGYELPKTVTVKMNGKPDPNFMYENGKITIAKVLGPIEITAAAVKLHAVEDKVENVTVEGTDNVAQGETFAGTIRPAGGYSLPYAISVMMNGRMLKAGEYSYDNVTGEVKIPNVSGPIQIVAKGVQDGYYEVILTLTNLTSDPASFEPRAEDTKVELTLKPVSGYELPSSITVKMGEATLVAGTDYTYDKATGKFSLEKIADRLLITAKGHLIYVPEPEPEPTPTYTVTLPVVEGAVIAATGSTTVNEGSNLSFTVEVKEGYNADNMVVKANGTTLTADANGRYTIANIRSNVVVTVSGIVKGDNPTGIDSVTDAELKVWAANGQLHIRTPKAEMAYIVTFDGRAYKTLSLPAGEYAEQMPRGAYIVHIGGQSYKLRF